ncbi:MAG: hypothetical protein ABSB74_05465 [Tepidisphaeraceae bacterium]
MSDSLSNGGQSDRDGNGRFRPGHRLPGPGNPNLAVLNKHRAALVRAIRSADLRESLKVMVELFRDKAVSPSVRLSAAIAFQCRVLGTPAQTDVLERIEKLEAIIEARAPENAPGWNGNRNR